MAARDDNPGSTLAVLGGGALLAYLLLRRGGARALVDDGEAAAAVSRPLPPRPCRVHVTARGLEVDGTTMDAASAVRACASASEATLTATGDARAGEVVTIARALEAAGVHVAAAAELLELVRMGAP